MQPRFIWPFLLILSLLTACAAPANPQLGASFSVREAVNSQDTSGFARAVEPRPFVFPQDHGPHPEFQIEWWYWTGNFTASDGRRLGLQFTIFRRALRPQAAERASNWATANIYMAHLALSDPQNRRFYSFERFARDGAGLAGASGEPFQVFLEDWQVTSSGPEGMRMHLRADAGSEAIDLTLDNSKPVVLQGDRGLSQKGEAVGNASYYYSLTRMNASGTITLQDEVLPVSGSAWMDREWSTSVLDENVIGWDWFALQLDDGREIMFYLLRQRDGQAARFSSGVLVERDGSTRKLSREEVDLQVLATWQSPRSGAEYPSQWQLNIPSAQLELTITPVQPDQELAVTVVYWEGAVDVRGTSNGQPLSGLGYVELTGYAEAGEGRF